MFFCIDEKTNLFCRDRDAEVIEVDVTEQEMVEDQVEEEGKEAREAEVEELRSSEDDQPLDQQVGNITATL